MFSFRVERRIKSSNISGSFDTRKKNRLQIFYYFQYLTQEKEANADIPAARILEQQISPGNALQAGTEVHTIYICPHMNTHPSQGVAPYNEALKCSSLVAVRHSAEVPGRYSFGTMERPTVTGTSKKSCGLFFFFFFK